MSKPKSGTFLEWNQIQHHLKHLHDISVNHLIEVWPKLRDRIGNPATWGDEIEYQILGLDAENHEPYLSMKQPLILEKLADSDDEIDWQPEYAEYMVECAPAKPYQGYKDISQLEQKLIARRTAIKNIIEPHEAAFSLSLFPLLHVSELSKALGLSLEDHEAILQKAIAPVGRYTILHKNLVSRSRREYHAEVPIFLDSNTIEHLENSSKKSNDILTLPNGHPTIVLEDIIFAMGGCGLQVTFQTESLLDVRKLHDQLCVLGPIFLSLTAATPIYKGMLVDTDTRWSQACNMVDDRTPEEMIKLTTRWSTSPMYLSPEIQSRDDLSPSDLERHEEIEAQLKESGLDPIMAIYFANLHLRDPLVLYGDESAVVNMNDADVHQSICGSVWSHVRLKVPGAETPENQEEPEGWRVEFRPMEVQLTDFANAAFLVFTQLLRDVLVTSNLDLYMSLTTVRENMDRAHTINSVLEEKFWFPRNPYPNQRQVDDLTLMSIDEIINGPKNQTENNPSSIKFEGLIPLIQKHIDPKLYQDVAKYLKFISERASGLEPTPAAWQRKFVQNHHEYSFDSVVTSRIAYDMLCAIRVMN